MTKLPKDFVRQTQKYIGEEWPELALALAQPPTRAVRLQKFTAAASEETPSAKVSTEVSTPWYAAGPLAPQPAFVARHMYSPVPWYDSASYISLDSPLGKTVFHELGGIYIQEASAMAAVAALRPQPHERILDLCAAPGSKSTAIGRQLKGQTLLYANEIVPARAKVLAQNLERSGVPALVTNDSPARLAAVWAGKFDAVLVDAPCSGEGMFRKDLDAASQWSLENVEMCALRQQDILHSAVKLVKPGGRLVYSTCTLNPVENEQVAAWACRHLPLQLEQLPHWNGWDTGRPEYADNGVDIEYTRRLWPHRGNGEGHFVALFSVTEGSQGGAEVRSSNHRNSNDVESNSTKTRYPTSARDKIAQGKTGKTKSGSVQAKNSLVKGHALRNWKEWMKTVVATDVEVFGEPIQHGDGIYVFAETTLPLKNVHVVRNGICTAVVHNQRFIPHHQFAMALQPQVFIQHKRLDEDEALAYLGGNALGSEDSNGWYGLSFAGIPAGWGKAVPGRLNNLYPKGLRKSNLIAVKQLD